MLRSGMLRVAGNQRVERLVRESRLTQPLVGRFVADEQLDGAINETQALNTAGMSVTLDMLGENVTDDIEATDAYHAYLAILYRIGQISIDANISIKLTMLGLDISETIAATKLEQLVAHAADRRNFVRIDMEGSAYTDRTLALFRHVHDRYPDSVGIVLQSCLHRTDHDIEEMIARGARVRLVKGAYKEPPSIAYRQKRDVDAAYRRQAKQLLDAGHYPAIATHDTAIIHMVKGYAQQNSIDASGFEFQMLYGIRRDLQYQLTSDGYRMRVYVPYGDSWYPYFVRRLAERPANILFVARNLFKA